MDPLLLFSFTLASACARWQSIDDIVMGGVSHSTVDCRDGALRFSGIVSLENNGGFASMRSAPASYDLSGYAGIALHLTGDGRTYKLNLKTDPGFDGVQYQASFATRGDAQIVRLPFETFVPRLRGHDISAPPLNTARIATFGVLIADKQAGPFDLRIARIEAWR